MFGDGAPENMFPDFDIRQINRDVISMMDWMVEEIELGNPDKQAKLERKKARQRRRRGKDKYHKAIDILPTEGVDPTGMHPHQYYLGKRREKKHRLLKNRADATVKRSKQKVIHEQFVKIKDKNMALAAKVALLTESYDVKEEERIEFEEKIEARAIEREEFLLRQEARREEKKTKDHINAVKTVLMKKIMTETTQGMDLKGMTEADHHEQDLLDGSLVESMSAAQRAWADQKRHAERKHKLHDEVVLQTVFEEALQLTRDQMDEVAWQARQKEQAAIDEAQDHQTADTAADAQPQTAAKPGDGAAVDEAKELFLAKQHAQQDEEHAHHHLRHAGAHEIDWNDPWQAKVSKQMMFDIIKNHPTLKEKCEKSDALSPLLEEPWKEKIGAKNAYLDCFNEYVPLHDKGMGLREWLILGEMISGTKQRQKKVYNFMKKAGLLGEVEKRQKWEKDKAAQRAKKSKNGRNNREHVSAHVRALFLQAAKERESIDLIKSVRKKWRRARTKLLCFFAFARLHRWARWWQEELPWWKQKHIPLVIHVDAYWCRQGNPGGYQPVYDCAARHRRFEQSRRLRDTREQEWLKYWEQVKTELIDNQEQFIREVSRVRAGVTDTHEISAVDLTNVKACLNGIIDQICEVAEKEEVAHCMKDMLAIVEVVDVGVISDSLLEIVDFVCYEEEQVAAVLAGIVNTISNDEDRMDSMSAAERYLLGLQEAAWNEWHDKQGTTSSNATEPDQRRPEEAVGAVAAEEVPDPESDDIQELMSLSAGGRLMALRHRSKASNHSKHHVHEVTGAVDEVAEGGMILNPIETFARIHREAESSGALSDTDHIRSEIAFRETHSKMRNSAAAAASAAVKAAYAARTAHVAAVQICAQCAARLCATSALEAAECAQREVQASARRRLVGFKAQALGDPSESLQRHNEVMSKIRTKENYRKSLQAMTSAERIVHLKEKARVSPLPVLVKHKDVMDRITGEEKDRLWLATLPAEERLRVVKDRAFRSPLPLLKRWTNTHHQVQEREQSRQQLRCMTAHERLSLLKLKAQDQPMQQMQAYRAVRVKVEGIVVQRRLAEERLQREVQDVLEGIILTIEDEIPAEQRKLDLIRRLLGEMTMDVQDRILLAKPVDYTDEMEKKMDDMAWTMREEYTADVQKEEEARRAMYQEEEGQRLHEERLVLYIERVSSWRLAFAFADSLTLCLFYRYLK
jgi:hypothetical protein